MKIALTGSTGVLGKTFFRKFNKKYSFTFFSDRVENSAALEDWIQKEKPDAVLHFAALVPTSICEQNPSKAILSNVIGTSHLLQAVYHHCPSAWIFIASSSHVYANSTQMISEASKTEPITFYGLTKLQQEQTALYLAGLWKLNVCVGRIFSYSAQDQKDNYFIPSVVRKLFRAAPSDKLQFFGGGNVRDFLTAEDVVVAIAKLMKGKVSGIFNICSGKGRKIENIILDIQKVLGRMDLKIQVEKDKNKSKLIGSNKKLVSKIYYTPEFDLKKITLQIAERLKHADRN